VLKCVEIVIGTGDLQRACTPYNDQPGRVGFIIPCWNLELLIVDVMAECGGKKMKDQDSVVRVEPWVSVLG